ncbi:MAG: hypothetical protein Q9199_005706 [Rusavskia elegans]
MPSTFTKNDGRKSQEEQEEEEWDRAEEELVKKNTDKNRIGPRPAGFLKDQKGGKGNDDVGKSSNEGKSINEGKGKNDKRCTIM